MQAILKRAVLVGAGLAMKRAINWPFDLILYPAMMVWLGHLWGGVVMTILSLFLNLLVIAGYDWAKTDWLLIEALKKLRDDPPDDGWRGVVGRTLRKGDVPAFFILCADDPITATLYLRHGSHQYNGLSRRDWRIFLAATMVANLYWIAGWAVVIEAVRFLSWWR